MKWVIRRVAPIGLMLIAAPSPGLDTTAPLTQFPNGPSRFVWGVWTQSVATHQQWTKRGINTLVTQDAAFPGFGYSAAQYDASAEKLGLSQIRGPGEGANNTATKDCKDPKILAWSLPDEPDGNKSFNSAQLGSISDGWRTQCRTKAIFANYLGINMFYQLAKASPVSSPYLDYLGLPQVTWTGSDFYPDQAQNQRKPPLLLLSSWNMGSLQPYLTTSIGAATANVYNGPYRGVRPASVGNPVFQFLGTGHVDLTLPNPKPTPARRFRLLGWSSIVNGVSGLIMFPQVVGTLTTTAAAVNGELTVKAAGWPDALINPDKIYAGLRLVCAGCNGATIVGQRSGTRGGAGSYSLSSKITFSSRTVTLQSPITSSGDDSDPKLLSELATMTRNVATMQDLGILMDRGGGRRKFQVWHAIDIGVDPNAIQASLPYSPGNLGMLPRPFEGATMEKDGVTWFLVLNLCDCTSYLTHLRGPWQVNTMSFRRYEVKLFSSVSQQDRFIKAGIED